MFEILVGAVIFDNNGKILLVEEEGQNKGLLNLPMGHLEKNESLIMGAKREILEETGFNVEINSLVDSKIFELNNKNYVSFVFKGLVLGEKQSKSELKNCFYDFSFIKANTHKLRNKTLIISAIENAQKNLNYLDILK